MKNYSISYSMNMKVQTEMPTEQEHIYVIIVQKIFHKKIKNNKNSMNAEHIRVHIFWT